MMRWQFQHPLYATYTMPKNPRAMGNIVPAHTTSAERSPNGAFRMTRNPQGPFPWSFTGRLHSQAEYDAMVLWGQYDKCVIQDHLGRQHSVIPQGCALTVVPAENNGTRNPWLYDYEFKTLYLGRLT